VGTEVTSSIKNAILGVAIIALSGCTMPRGAALSSEILKEKDANTATFQVEAVTRANLKTISKWPATGWSGHYHWINASRGPDSSVIRAGDKISLVIWDNQENSLLTSENQKTVDMPGLQVSSSGTIFVPYLDEVQVSGMTPADARTKIQSALAPIVPSAQVQLALEAGKQNSVDLVSGVANPGTYKLPDRNHTVLSLIAQGGGIAPTLRNPLVRLIRDSKTYEIRADRLFSDGSKNATLRGNDKLLVQEDNRYFTALGATGSESIVYFPQENVTALESLSMTGGLSDSRANLKGVLVLREYPAKTLRNDGSGPAMQQVVFTFDLTSADGLFAARGFQINPGDTILASEASLTITRNVFSLIGSAFGLVSTASNI